MWGKCKELSRMLQGGKKMKFRSWYLTDIFELPSRIGSCRRTISLQLSGVAHKGSSNIRSVCVLSNTRVVRYTVTGGRERHFRRFVRLQTQIVYRTAHWYVHAKQFGAPPPQKKNGHVFSGFLKRHVASIYSPRSYTRGRPALMQSHFSFHPCYFGQHMQYAKVKLRIWNTCAVVRAHLNNYFDDAGCNDYWIYNDITKL